MQSLEDMELFATVVQSRSLSEAGRKVGMSPATVSRHVGRLEAALGVQLLKRSSRNLELTEIGRIYFQRSEQVLSDVRELTSLVSHHRATPAGILHIHTHVVVGIGNISEALPAFLRKYPEIQVRLALSEDIASGIDNNIDIEVRMGRSPDSSLMMKKLVSSRRILFATKSYLDRSSRIERPGDLLLHNCLTYMRGKFGGGPATWRFRGPGGPESVRVVGNLQTNNAQVLKVGALEGLGVALLPEWLIREEIAAGTVVRVLPTYEASPASFDHGIYAIYQPSRHVPLKIQVFLSFLQQVFRQRGVG